MEERSRIHFRVGVVVIATFLITGLLIAMIADRSLFTFKDKYRVNVVLPQAPGVAQGTPVHKNGVLIGRVERVDLKDDGVIVVMLIEADRHIRKNEVARLSSSILGDAVLEIVPGKIQSKEFVQNEDTIAGTVRPNPLDIITDMQGDVARTFSSVEGAADEISTLAKKVNVILDEADTQKIQDLLANTQTAMESFTKTMNSIDKIVGDEEIQKNLREGLRDLPKLVSEANDTMQRVQGAIDAAEENLKNLQGITGPIGERGDSIVGSLESAAANLDKLLGQVATFTTTINNNEGTIGMLLKDRALYDETQATIKEIHDLTRRLQPIIQNVNVLTNKLARDPARAARGIFKPEAPLK